MVVQNLLVSMADHKSGQMELELIVDQNVSAELATARAGGARRAISVTTSPTTRAHQESKPIFRIVAIMAELSAERYGSARDPPCSEVENFPLAL